MHTTSVSPTRALDPKVERLALALKVAGWVCFWVLLAFAIATSLILTFAISGRTFSQEVAVQSAPGVTEVSQAATPGLGVGIFWAVVGVVVLLVSIYLAFRYTRFARRFRSPDPALHPHKQEVLAIFRWGIIVGLAGLVVTILGGGASIGVLLTKSIAQPQGVAIYDPSRIIRSLDVFVALANMNGITAHFISMATALGMYTWLDKQ